MSGTRRSTARPVRKEITFGHEEWSRSRELFEQVKGGRGYTTYTDFARDMLMHGAVHTVRVTTDPATIRPEISRIGNNINQIARAANSTGLVSIEELKAIREDMQHLTELLTALHHDFNTAVTEGWH